MHAPDERLEGIAQVGKLAAALKKGKEVAANRAVVDYLEDLVAAADNKEKELSKAKAVAGKMEAANQKKTTQKEKAEKEEDEADDSDEDEEEEEGGYADRLLTAFKKVKTLNGKPLAFIVCDARPFPNIIIAKRITSKHKQELTEITGGSRKFLKVGSCHFVDGQYVFTMQQSLPGLARKIQRSVKNHIGKKLKISHGGETAGDDDEQPEGEQPEGEPAEGEQPKDEPTAETVARPAAPGSPGQTPPPKPAAPPPAQEMEVLEDRRRDFKKARAAWVKVKSQAEEDLEKVKDGARMQYLADAKQFPKVVQGCKEIDEILDNLDDELRDTLDQYASTPLKNQAKLQDLAATAAEIVDRYRKFVEDNKVMKAIDMKEFADVTIHAPVMKALGDLRRALS